MNAVCLQICYVLLCQINKSTKLVKKNEYFDKLFYASYICHALDLCYICKTIIIKQIV